MSTTTAVPVPPASESAPARYTVGALGASDAGQMQARLAADGLVLFEGLASPAELLAVAAPLMQVVAHPDSGPDKVTAISDLGPVGDRPGQAGFSRRALAAHTDRAGVQDPPGLIMVACARPGDSGGQALLTDGAAVYADLAEHDPQTLAAFQIPRSVLFGGSGGHNGAVFTSEPAADGAGRVRVRLRLDEFAAWGPSLTDHHLHVLTAAISRHTFTVPLVTGRGYLADNHRWLHARAAFTGPRLAYRVLGTPHPGLGLATGIPAALSR